MPCKSDGPYYDSVALAVILIYRHLDELADTFHPAFTPLGGSKFRHWEDLRACYGNLDKLTALLCERLRSVDVTRYSLELQMWYRDHQAADKAREERVAKEDALEARKQAALAKLTDEERELLGFFRLGNRQLRKMSDAI